MKFDRSQYTSRTAMHCSTEEDAQIFLNFLDSIGQQWSNGEQYNKTYWHNYQQDTCYSFCDNRYGSIGFYTREGYTVLEFSDFDWGDDPKTPEVETMTFEEAFYGIAPKDKNTI